MKQPCPTVLAYYMFACYLLGSIPFALLVTRLTRRIDIRHHGSGNVGATNVARIAGKKWGVVVFLLDGLKGAIPTMAVMNAYHYVPWTLCAATLSVLGHIFPIFLKFKGGKGVSTALFCFAVIDHRIALVAGMLWLIVFLSSKYVSLASITAMLVSAVAAIMLYGHHQYGKYYIGFFCLISSAVIFKHHANLTRIKKGRELSF